MRLICEHNIITEAFEFVVEQKNADSPKNLYISGIYAVADRINENQRMYSKNALEKAITEYNDSQIKYKRSVGEMNHPQTIDIDYNNCCHIIENMTQDGNVWYGKSRVLTGTPKGDLLAGLLNNGVQVGMSTRGVGDVDGKGRVNDYKLVTVDVVSNPSAGAYGAWVNGILESKQYIIDTHGMIMEKSFDTFEKSLVSLPKHSEDRKVLVNEAITKFLKEFSINN